MNRIKPLPENASEAGFSILELMVASTLLALVLGSVLTLLTGGQNAFEAQSADMSMRQSGRVALDKLTRETRLAGYGIDNVPQAITVASGTSIQFAADIDDGDTAAPCNATYETASNGGAERITYTLTGSNLMRAVDCWDGSSWTSEIAAQVLISDLEIGQTVFTYFDEDGNALTGTLTSAQRDEIRSIGIQLRLEDLGYTHVVGRATTAMEFATQVEVHNLF